jgi:hypothetical protein
MTPLEAAAIHEARHGGFGFAHGLTLRYTTIRSDGSGVTSVASHTAEELARIHSILCPTAKNGIKS